MRKRSAAREWWTVGGILLLGASVALGASGCLGEDSGEEDDPDVSAESASLEAVEDDCAPSDVSWANPADESSACAGPWVYYKYAAETSPSSLCPGEVGCAQYNSCSRWVDMPAARPSKTYDIIQNCSGPPGEQECEDNWTAANFVCEQFRVEQWPLVDAPQDQRVVSANASVGFGPGIPPNHYTRFKCQVVIEYQKRFDGPDPSCGCAVPVYPSCQHAIVVATPPVRVVTDAGQTKTQARAAHSDPIPGQLTGAQIQPVCTTGEDQPSLVAKLDRLMTNLGDPAIAPPGGAVFAELVRRAKLTYELFDRSAVAAASDGLHAVAVDLYQTHPDLEPTCGRHAAAVAAPCDDETDWRLRFCTRMSSSHVGGDLARRVYEVCIGQLGALADAIEGEVCADDDPYVAASVEAHRRLHEKVLVRFGTALVDPVTSKVDDSADVLHLIDGWYAQAARVLPATEVGDELALVTNKFWQAAHGYKVDAEQTGWIDQSLYGDLQAELDDAEGQSAGDARQIVDAAMELTELRGLELDRAVLTAAYADAAPGEPVLAGEPLLRVTADALGPLVERVDALVQFHDAGCSLLDCGSFSTPTRLSRVWKALAYLTAGPGSSPSLSQVLAATPGTMAGWKPVFQLIQGGQQRLLDAIAEQDADGAGDLRAIVEQARARTASYEATGLFLPAVGNRLYTGVHAAQRDRVRDQLDELHDIMTGERQDVENRLVSLVDGLVRVRDADTSLAQLSATKERLIVERDDLATRAASFRALVNGGAGSDSSIFEQLMAEWAAIEGSIDEQAYLRVDDSTDLFLTGGDATFEEWTGANLVDIGVHKIEVAGKQTVSIATDGVWAPTCALREARVIDPRSTPRGLNGTPIDLAGALAGPEGYTISWTGSNMKAVSSHETTTDRITAGARGEGCWSTPGMSVTGDGLRLCVYVDASRTYEDGSSSQHALEGRTSTQFASGIFLPTTPFEAPAGSLVVVEMPPGQVDRAAIRDVHLVRGPHTTIAVDGPADLYLVVNDTTCDAQNTSNELHVSIRRFIGVGDSAKSLLSRMAYATSLIRARIPALMARGEVLTAEVTEMELSAKLDAIDVPGEVQVPVDEYPAPMRDLFYKYIAREMTQLEASVRVANLDREMRIKDAEFRATEIAVQNSAMDGYLVSLLPRWTVRGLRLKELRDVTSLYATDIRYYLGPLMQVWYPQVLDGLDDVTAVQELANVDVDQPVLQMTDLLLELGNALSSRIEDAQTPYPSPEDTAPSFVAVRFPAPAVLDPACADSPSARCRRAGESSTYRWATVAQTKALWNSLGQPGDGKTSRHLVFELAPEDVYEVSSGSEYLSCTKSLPVVRRMGLALTGFTASSLPGDHRAIEGTIPATAPMAFVDATGVTSFELANPSWRSLANVPLVYGTSDYGKVRTDFTAIAQDVRGVSPFTTFVFDIPEATVVEWNLRSAKTIDVVLELEAVRASARVAVPACSAAP